MRGWLEVELAATDAWAAAGRVPAEAAAAGRERASFTVEAVKERERITNHDVAAFVDVVADSIGARGALDPLRAHLLRRARHRARAAAGRGRLDHRQRRDGVPRRAGGEGARARGDAVRRPHPRRPRRADHVRAAPGRLRVRGRPQPQPPARSVRAGGGRQALRRGRDLRLDPARDRGGGDGRPRAAAPRTSQPRSSPGIATRRSWVRSRWRAPGSSATRRRSATCSGRRCARSRSRSPPARRRAPRRCRTSATRSPRSGSAVSPGCCAGTRRRGSRTSPSGTSATSPTPAPSASILPDATILLDYMQHLSVRLVEGLGPPRPHAGEPRAHPRRDLQPAGADRADRVRDDPRRGLSPGPGGGAGRLGHRDALPRAAGRAGPGPGPRHRASTTTRTSRTCRT